MRRPKHLAICGYSFNIKELVGLTVAEPMPRTAIRLKEMLGNLPLLR